LARQGQSELGKARENSLRWQSEQRSLKYLQHFRVAHLVEEGTRELDDFARNLGLKWVRDFVYAKTNNEVLPRELLHRSRNPFDPETAPFKD
jgi:hypothetical protein